MEQPSKLLLTFQFIYPNFFYLSDTGQKQHKEKIRKKQLRINTLKTTNKNPENNTGFEETNKISRKKLLSGQSGKVKLHSLHFYLLWKPFLPGEKSYLLKKQKSFQPSICLQKESVLDATNLVEMSSAGWCGIRLHSCFPEWTVRPTLLFFFLSSWSIVIKDCSYLNSTRCYLHLNGKLEQQL